MKNLFKKLGSGSAKKNTSFKKSEFLLDDEKKLLRTVVTSKLLVPEGTEIQDVFVKNNLHKDIDYSWLERTKAKIQRDFAGYNKGYCPNIYIGSDSNNVHEVFQPRRSIAVTIKQHDEPLIITTDDLKKFRNPKSY